MSNYRKVAIKPWVRPALSVLSHNLSRVIDAKGACMLCAWEVKRFHSARLGVHKPVVNPARRIGPDMSDLSGISSVVDAGGVAS